MSNDPTPPEHAAVATPEALQFERADFSQSAAAACAFCKQPAAAEYYQINGRIACASCREQIVRTMGGGAGVIGLVRALAAGVGAALAGFLIFWGIRAATGYEFALVAILVGWMVGKAVRWGTQNRGGRVYQVLAVVLTYLAIASTYTPDILKGMREARAERAAAGQSGKAEDTSTSERAAAEQNSLKSPESAGKPVPFVFELLAAFVISLAAPFLAGPSNLIGWIIIAVGLMQAWRLTRRVQVEIAGPFRTATA